MARDAKYDILFEPVQLGPKRMRNRFCQVPHCIGAGSDQPEFQASFRAMKAQGGWAAVFTEVCTIAPDSDIDPFVAVRLWDDDDVENLRLTCERVHHFDSLAGIELTYSDLFVTASSSLTREPNRKPTQRITDGCFMGGGKPMDLDDIRQVQALYVQSAKRARDAGFDLITLYATHGHPVLTQFLLPAYNRRTDAYGGSFENRMRFTREVLKLVRDAVGDECAIGLRFGVDTLPDPFGFGESGLAPGEGHRFIAALDDLVDYWDINVGPPPSMWGEDAASSRTHPENHEKPYVDGVKRFTTKPVVNVGRFTNPDTMVRVIREGQCDIIGAARPSIADPFLPKKIEEGRLDEIRECIGCNICISRWEQGGPRIACTQNATSGEEFRRGWHPERFTAAKNRESDVLIIGAGPAGMECAVVLGKRGMRRVHLVDRNRELGGSLRWITKLPGLGEWARLVDYRRIQVDKLKNVTFVPGRHLTADDLLEYGAEIVIVATGARWADDGVGPFALRRVPGADSTLPHVLTPEQVMVEGKAVGNRVVVFDAEGYFMGHSIAAKLRGEGHEVTLLTTHPTVAPYTVFTLEQARVRRDLHLAGIPVVTDHVLTRIAEDGVTVEAPLVGEAREIASDSVLLVTQRYSETGLYDEVRTRGEEHEAAGVVALHRIGDCVSPDLIAQAIFDGHRLAREIDSPDPTSPRPFTRERALQQPRVAADALVGS